MQTKKSLKFLMVWLIVSAIMCFVGLGLLLQVSALLKQSANVGSNVTIEGIPFANGDGTESNPYLVSNAEELNNVRNFLYQKDENGDFDLSKPNYFLQVEDINLSLTDFNSADSGNFDPIGSVDYPFAGTYDGNGFTISGMYIDSTASNVGLFSYISSSGKVLNLSISSTEIKGNGIVGAIAGTNAGEIKYCFNDSVINGTNSAGLVGQNDGIIEDSYNNGQVIGSLSAGIASINNGTISRVYNSGSIASSGAGIVYQNNGSIQYAVYINNVSVGVKNGTNDINQIVSATETQMKGNQKVSVNGQEFYVNEFINLSAPLMPAFYYSFSSSYLNPQIWINPQDQSLRIEGDGTASSPYIISSPQALSLIGKSLIISNNKTLNFGLDDFYIQNADISFIGVDTNGETAGNFDPIGYVDSTIKEFSGSYVGENGNNKRLKISDFKINSNLTQIGFIVQVGKGGVVENLSFRSNEYVVNTQEKYGLGTIAATNDGNIINCDNYSNIDIRLIESQFSGGSSNIGGLVASNNGTISLSANLGNIIAFYNGEVGPSTATSFVGGICATNNGIIEKSYNAGNLKGGQSGGIACVTGNQINHCFNYGDVEATLSAGEGSFWACGISCNIAGSVSYTFNLGKADYGVAAIIAGSLNNVFYVEGLSSKGAATGTGFNTINVNQLAGVSQYNGQNILDLFNSEGQIWIIDRSRVCEDGNSYQFIQIAGNYAEKTHSRAMKMTVDGFNIVDSPQKFVGVGTNAYNSIFYSGDGKYILASDIDCSGISYVQKDNFSGEFNGAGHTISNVNHSSGSYADLGLFSIAEGNAQIYNFNLINSNFNNTAGSGRCGAIVGSSGLGVSIKNIQTKNCYVEGNSDTGGFIGQLTNRDSASGGIIENCAVIGGRGRLDGNDAGAPGGGFIGCMNGGHINKCFAQNDNVSGGENNLLMWGWTQTGGFVGVTGSNALIENCFSYGSIWVERVVLGAGIDNDSNGGFVGKNSSGNTIIKNSYAYVVISLRKNLGWYTDSDSRGFGKGAQTSWYNNYCLSGQTTTGASGATELSTDQMHQQSSYAGFDFDNIWQMDGTWNIPVPTKNSSNITAQGIFKLNTDGGATVQLFKDGTLVQTKTVGSFGGVEFTNLVYGQYTAKIFRYGQSVNTLNNIEELSFEISQSNSSISLNSIKWFDGGNGSQESPYIINSYEQLAKLNNFAGEGDDTYFKLEKDLDLKKQELTAINDFKGCFDGNNKEIYNFVITSGSGEIGLFATIENAEIKNLGVSVFEISTTSNEYIGVLVGEAVSSTISNCYVENGYIISNGTTGGLVGLANQTIVSKSYANVNITASFSQSSFFAGGLVGNATNETNIEECYSAGQINGQNNIGGFVGSLESSKVTNSFTTSKVISSYNNASDSAIGGFAGNVDQESSISLSFMHGNTYSSIGFGNLGSFIGKNQSSNLSYNYVWNVNNFKIIFNGENLNGITSLATDQFLSASNFAGFDFISIWGMSNESYPILRNVANAGEINEVIMGSGTENDPYLIFDAETLKDIESYTLARNQETTYFKLMKDIDLSGEEWEGMFASETPFAGIIDGNGFSISNISLSQTNSYGIFNYATNATFKNLKIVSPKIQTTSSMASALIGNAQNCTFENIIISGGVISGGDYVGGLVAEGQSNSFNNIQITSLSLTSSSIAGGVIGSSSEDSFANILVSSNQITAQEGGAVAGKSLNSDFGNIETIENILNGTNVGGIVGSMQSGNIILSNSSLNNLSGTNAGGFVGSANGIEVTSCYIDGLLFNGVQNGGGVAGELLDSTVLGVNADISNTIETTVTLGVIVGTASNSSIQNCTVNSMWSSSFTNLTSLYVGVIAGQISDMISVAENRITKVVLTVKSGGGIGQFYGQLSGNGNLNNNLYREITLNSSSAGVVNNLTGTTITDSYNTASGLQTYEWVIVA